MRESAYQRYLIRILEAEYPGCVILKNDPNYRQGIPDLVIFYEDRWAFLEVKMDLKSGMQPNQRHYIDKLDSMGFAAFICPETEVATLYALQLALRPGR